MGQFASRAFDGDPYIDIMRALPDKELVWWVQKVIWLAEGFTILEHFGRTYPDIFMHKCSYCNGAGTMTCPQCKGYKVRRAHAHALRLSEQTTVGRLLAAADLEECNHCGTYCAWDHESDWQEEWAKWEQKLSYYDRTYGDVMNEWYEDVINEGRLDEDTQPEHEPMPSKDNPTVSAHISREVSKDKNRIKALMRRVGGHPYEHSHMMPYGVIDPQASLTENMENMGFMNFDLPPELHPEKFPELLLEGPNGRLQQFDRQIQQEYLIMNNLDAAMRDSPKPAMFKPTAGTVECPVCAGQAWYHKWVPNVHRLLKAEQPFWSRTLAHMSPYWGMYSTSDLDPTYSPWIAALAAPDRPDNSLNGAEEPGIRQRMRLGEVPTQPPLLTPAQVQAADRVLRPGAPAKLDENIANIVGARRRDGGIDYGRVASAIGSSLPSAPSYVHEHGKKILPNPDDINMALSDLVTMPAGSGTRVYGPDDPIAADVRQALTPTEMAKQALNAPGGPLLRGDVLTARLLAADVANPARASARAIRDARQLGKAVDPEEQEAMLKWAQQRHLN